MGRGRRGSTSCHKSRRTGPLLDARGARAGGSVTVVVGRRCPMQSGRGTKSGTPTNWHPPRTTRPWAAGRARRLLAAGTRLHPAGVQTTRMKNPGPSRCGLRALTTHKLQGGAARGAAQRPTPVHAESARGQQLLCRSTRHSRWPWCPPSSELGGRCGENARQSNGDRAESCPGAWRLTSTVEDAGGPQGFRQTALTGWVPSEQGKSHPREPGREGRGAVQQVGAGLRRSAATGAGALVPARRYCAAPRSLQQRLYFFFDQSCTPIRLSDPS